MTRLPRRPAPAERRDRAPRHGRHRPGRHRLDRPGRTRRYAAAGLLALSGVLLVPALHPGGAEARTATPRPLATRSAPRVVTTRAARAAARRPARGAARAARLVTRTVAGPTLRGRATWYGPGFEGRRTASGEVFRSRQALTAAHRTLPFGTRLRVCHRRRCVVVRVNDRGPYGAAILDLSWLAAHHLRLTEAGIAPVTATVLTTQRVRVRS